MVRPGTLAGAIGMRLGPPTKQRQIRVARLSSARWRAERLGDDVPRDMAFCVPGAVVKGVIKAGLRAARRRNGGDEVAWAETTCLPNAAPSRKSKA